MLTPTPRVAAVNPDPNLTQERRTDPAEVAAALQACVLVGRARRVVCAGQLWSAHLGLEGGLDGGVVVQLIEAAPGKAPFPAGLPPLGVWVDTGLVVWRFTLTPTQALGAGRWRCDRPAEVECEG